MLSMKGGPLYLYRLTTIFKFSFLKLGNVLILHGMIEMTSCVTTKMCLARSMWKVSRFIVMVLQVIARLQSRS